MEPVGFVGLGSIGAPMAGRLVDSGRRTLVWARRAGATKDLADRGAIVVSDVAELGRHCALIGLCVRNGDDVEQVLDEQGLLASMQPGSVLAIHSTVDPAEVRNLAERAAAREISVADAPVSGGPSSAAAGKLVAMVGASPEVFERIRPIFASFARSVVRVGLPGSGQVAKLINNALFTANLRLAGDAVDLGGALGLDREVLRDVLRSGSASSFALDEVIARLSLEEFGATAGGDLLRKDVGLVRRVLADAQIDGAELVRVAEGGLVRMGLIEPGTS